MTKTFDLLYIPYCTKDLRHFLKPLPTTDELLRLKQYFHYQKNLARRLINYQRSLTTKYIRRDIRFNVDNCQIPKTLPDIHHINKRQILDSKTSVTSIDNTKPESPIKKIDTIIIKLNTCSTLIATGHGIATIKPSPITTDIEQLNSGTIDEDISLSKTYTKVFNRHLLRRQINPKLSNIYSFTVPNNPS
jgi:hypothetical protein